jgi:hypothetical protein
MSGSEFCCRVGIERIYHSLHGVISVSSLNAMTPYHRCHFRVNAMTVVLRTDRTDHLVALALALAPIRYDLLL